MCSFHCYYILSYGFHFTLGLFSVDTFHRVKNLSLFKIFNISIIKYYLVSTTCHDSQLGILVANVDFILLLSKWWL